MNPQSREVEKIIHSLNERVKELSCIYRVEELLQDYDADHEAVLRKIVAVIPVGYSYADICEARITYRGQEYKTPGFTPTAWMMSAKIYAKREIVGALDVCYTQEIPGESEGPFLKEERKLIEALADSIGHFIMHQELKRKVENIRSVQTRPTDPAGKSAKTILDLLSRTDQDLYIRIARKLLNHLYQQKLPEASHLFKQFSLERSVNFRPEGAGDNQPLRNGFRMDSLELSERAIEIAMGAMNDDEIVALVERWLQEDKVGFLIRVLNSPGATLDEIIEKMRRFQQLSARDNLKLPEVLHQAICVHLVRRLMSDSLSFINVAKNFVRLEDFYDLLPMLIYPTNSYGKLGGKGSGLFVAFQVIKNEIKDHELLKNVRVPKTYYLTTDGIYNFIDYNSLGEVFEQKYKGLDQIRQEYPQLIEIMKNGEFPPEIVQQLSIALDDLGTAPLIVRSSSLLEDQLGSAFSGKYKSLFLGNQGTKAARLEALLDAIAEVFASTFSPDPMEYRAERGLLDAQEEMGVLIEEVVGTRVGPYYFPLFAGVAFSRNEHRWSPRIRREDGLMRLVPGLGTRAVDRVSDDYPILIAPGQPNLRVNVTEEESIRYSPAYMDVINLEKNTFETIPVKDFFREYGDQMVGLDKVVSLNQDGNLREITMWGLDFQESQPVVTFNGLIKNTQVIKQVHEILKLLQAKCGYPVDIEFASDGSFFYLLQCRPQSYGRSSKPVPIPSGYPEAAVLFTARKYVANGLVPNITHVVYVDPLQYNQVEKRETLLDVGRAISRLNAILPKRRFILMGPGRWGSRGDIRLGVSVTYSGINNTAMLVEIARKWGNYIPDLSFGTHFFQDLVESDIQYLPLYPDDENIIFNEEFFNRAENALPEILPEYAYLGSVVKVIEVAKNTKEGALHIFMNADLDEAMGILAKPISVTSVNQSL